MNLAIWIPEWVERLGWVLLHFVWQGLLIGVVSWMGMIFLKKSSAQSRYLLLCTALLTCILTPCITWIILANKSHRNTPVANLSVDSIQTNVTSGSTLTTTEITSAGSFQEFSPSSGWTLKKLEGLVAPRLPYLVTIWSIGVIFLSLRLLYGWIQLRRLFASGVPVADRTWGERLHLLSEKMGIAGPITLLESILIEVPTVIGWMQPVILVPVTFLTGLPSDQIEAILAHELAHIQRHDYFVNLIQIAAETLLFYHPVVWWISKSIREERENCCDDIALRVVGDKAVYVSALAALEESRSLPMAITMSVAGGSLLQRIKRIIGVGGGKDSSWLVLAALLMLAVAASAGMWEAKHHGQAEKMVSKVSDGATNSVAPRKEVEIEAQLYVGTQSDLEKVGISPIGLTLPNNISIRNVIALNGVFTSEQTQSLVGNLKKQRGVFLISAPKVTLSSGSKATVSADFSHASLGDISPSTLNGTFQLDAQPTLGPDGQTIDLNHLAIMLKRQGKAWDVNTDDITLIDGGGAALWSGGMPGDGNLCEALLITARVVTAKNQPLNSNSAPPLKVTCTDESGAPVAGAEVYLVEVVHQPPYGTVGPKRIRAHGPELTDATGQATFSQLTPTLDGQWRRSVYARIPGKLAGGLFRENTTETPAKPGEDAALHVTMQPTVSVSGRVEVPPGFSLQSVKVKSLGWELGYDYDKDESGIGEWNIGNSPQPWPFLVEFSPDANGSVTIPDVPVGARLYLAGDAPSLTESQCMISSVKDPAEEFLISLDHEGVIQGTVRDQNGNALSGELVQCQIQRGMFARTFHYDQTDAAGHFSFRKLPPSVFQVQLKTPDGLVSKPQLVRVTRGSTNTANLVLEPGAEVTGVVKDKFSGKGIPRVTLSFSPGEDQQGEGDTYESVETSSDGTFKIKLPSGNSTCTCDEPVSYMPLTQEGATVVRIVPGVTPSPITFELIPKATKDPKIDPQDATPAFARGRVIDFSGKPFAGVNVNSYYEPNKDVNTFPHEYGRATTRSDGVYSLSLLPYGTCHIRVGGGDFSIATSKDFSTTPGSQHQIEDLRVRPATARISGTVVDQTGSPLANFRVFAGSKHYASVDNVGVLSDLAGRFSCKHVLADEPVQLFATDYNSSAWTTAKPNSTNAVITVDLSTNKPTSNPSKENITSKHVDIHSSSALRTGAAGKDEIPNPTNTQSNVPVGSSNAVAPAQVEIEAQVFTGNKSDFQLYGGSWLVSTNVMALIGVCTPQQKLAVLNGIAQSGSITRINLPIYTLPSGQNSTVNMYIPLQNDHFQTNSPIKPPDQTVLHINPIINKGEGTIDLTVSAQTTRSPATREHQLFLTLNSGCTAVLNAGEVGSDGKYTLIFLQARIPNLKQKIAPSIGKIFTIETKIAALDESTYSSHKSEVDTAVKNGDWKSFSAIHGVDFISEPGVTTKEGLKASVSICDEIDFPTRFERGINGGWSPIDSNKTNVGVSVEMTPLWRDEKIGLYGVYRATDLEGMIRGTAGFDSPSFTTKESYFFEALNDGQTVGFMAPGRVLLKNRLLSQGDTSNIPEQLFFFITSKMNKTTVTYTP